MDRDNIQTNIYTDNTRRSVSVHRNVSRSWFKQSNDYPKNHGNPKRHGYHKYLYSVIASLFALPANAEVGGVSATAAPVANLSLIHI